jgi:hypothetical protein
MSSYAGMVIKNLLVSSFNSLDSKYDGHSRIHTDMRYEY